jgi:hypothetical protein
VTFADFSRINYFVMLQQAAPFFGYFASLCLIIALLVNTDIKFRIFNLLGNIAFIVYAIVFNAWPVLITNVILLFINLFYLNKIYRHKEDFELIEFKGEEKLIDKFLSFYRTDITGYFPGFSADQLSGKLNFAVLRDLVIANIFSVHITPAGDAEVVINYTSKKYRDYKVGRFIFEKEKQFLISKGVKRIVYKNVSNKKHESFLKVMGFTKNEQGYFKEI